MPPDNADGYLFIASGWSRTIFSLRNARSSITFSDSAVCSRNGNATLSMHGEPGEQRAVLEQHAEPFLEDRAVAPA